MMSIGCIISQMAKVLTNQYLNRTDCSPVVLNPLPKYPSLIKGLHQWPPQGQGPLPSPLQQSFRVWPKSGPRWSEVCKQEQLGISSGGGSGSLCPGPSSPWAVGEASIWWWQGWGAGLGCHGTFRGSSSSSFPWPRLS